MGHWHCIIGHALIYTPDQILSELSNHGGRTGGGRVSSMREIPIAYKILFGKPEGKRQVAISKRK